MDNQPFILGTCETTDGKTIIAVNYRAVTVKPQGAQCSCCMYYNEEDICHEPICFAEDGKLEPIGRNETRKSHILAHTFKPSEGVNLKEDFSILWVPDMASAALLRMGVNPKETKENT